MTRASTRKVERARNVVWALRVAKTPAILGAIIRMADTAREASFVRLGRDARNALAALRPSDRRAVERGIATSPYGRAGR